MKEKEFIKKYPKEIIEIPIYYSLDDYGNVLVDTDGMRDDFDIILNDILEQTIVEEKDELQKIVAEKLNKIKNGTDKRI